MSRNVPAALQTYMLGHGLHMTRLCRVGPFRDGTYKGFAFLDRNVTYDDGEMEIEYIARTGMQMSDFVSTANLEVDNAEAQTLQPVDGFAIEGISTDQIQSGVLDSVPFIVYALNYKDLTAGRHFIWSAGTIGEVRLPGTALINLEQRSITNKLLQNIGDVDSTTCRAKRLGTQPLGSEGTDTSGDPIVTEKFPCRYDVVVENVAGVITGIDADEPDLLFQDTGLLQEENFFAPGTVKFSTGSNIGIEREIEAFETGVILLKNALPWPAEIGDVFRIRRECTFHPIGHNSCQTFWGTSWVLHFRGEPYIPVSDAPANLVAGAATPTDIGGTGEPLPTNDPDTPPPTTDPPPGAGDSDGSGPTTRTHGATVYDPVTYGASPAASAATNSTAFAAAVAAMVAGVGGILRPSLTGMFEIDPSNPVRPISKTFIDLVTHNVKLKSAYSSTHTTPSVHRDVIRIDNVNNVEVAVNDLEGYLTLWTANGGTGAHGVSEWADGIYITNGATAITIRDATIYNCVGDGISVGYSCSDVIIRDFDISKCRRQGISMAADNYEINDGEISFISGTIPQCGIDIEPDNNNDATTGAIRRVTFTNNAAYGINVAPIDGGSINLDIEDCIFDGNSLGVVVGPSAVNTSITGCTFKHQRNPAIRLVSGSTGTTISGNTFWDNSTGSTPDTVVDSTKNITGTTSETTPHIQKQSGSAATIGSNTYQK